MANITNMNLRYIPTNKGNLRTPILYIDEALSSSNISIDLSTLPIPFTWAIFASYAAKTSFISDEQGVIEYDTNSNVLKIGTSTLSIPSTISGGAVYVISALVVGTNGKVGYLGNNSIYSRTNIDSSSTFTHTQNTSDLFGELTRITSWSGSMSCSENQYAEFLYNHTTGENSDPYSGAGDSDTGGGGGTFDGTSDPVPIPNLPPIGATDTGFISLFVPTMAQLNQVSSYLWSNFFDLATFKKIFEDPMDCILGLSVVPLTIPTSGNAQITVGNVELSGITLPLASQQYVELDCGTVDFTKKYFGSYLDQDPYTKMALFVPYSGVHAVNADDIMGKVIGLKYHIDILTGSLVAFVMCGDSVLYEFNGACASNIPVNSINYASTIENAIRIAVNIGTTVATAGAAASMTGAEAAGREAARTFGTAVNMAGSTADGILSLKPNIDRAGSLGGTSGLMGNQRPYFIITRPRLCKPENQNKIKGYPSFIATTVADLVNNGYTEFDSIILEGLYLTNAEKEELLTILKSGVYL